MPYVPKNIKPWIEYINYEGDNFDDYFIAYWRFFRCTPAERSNMKYIKSRLSLEDQTGIEYATFTDSLMMCRYYILIHKDHERALKIADMFARLILIKGGSLDPEGEVEEDKTSYERKWKMFSIERRVELCQEIGVSIFSARRDAIPESIIPLLSEVGT